MRILLVDDDPIFLEELSVLLIGDGHAVVTAPSALAALERLGVERFDVLLTDLKMPHSSGTQLIRAVHRRWPAVLTVILTGQPEEQSAADALDLEAFNYIPKPFRYDSVRSTLDLAEAEIAFRERLCAPRSLDEIRAELEGAPPEARVVLAPPTGPLPLAGSFSQDLDLARPGALGPMIRSRLEGRPSARVLLAAPGGLLRRVGAAALGRAMVEVRNAIPRAGRMLVGVDRDALSDGDLVALRWTLTDRTPRPFPCGLAGPRRRAMLRELASGPTDGPRLAERTGVSGTERIRFYLRYLTRGGLVTGDESRIALTERGHAPLDFLAELDRSGPRTPEGDLLFGFSEGSWSPPAVRE